MMLSQKAMIDNYRNEVWYLPIAITNIFLLKQVKKQYRVTYDSDDEYFVVHWQKFGLPDIIFREHESGLHYYDPRDQSNFTFVETVKENKMLFTKRQIRGAEQARRLYKCLSHPSITDFNWVLHSNGIKHCPVSLKDAETAEKVWGPNIATLKGKTTCKAAGAVEMEDLIPIPPELMAMDTDIILAIDICFVNGIPFFVIELQFMFHYGYSFGKPYAEDYFQSI